MNHRLPDELMWALLVFLLAAASLPVYARIVWHYAAINAPLSPGGHILAIVASLLAGIVVMAAIMAVLTLLAIAADWMRRKMRRP